MTKTEKRRRLIQASESLSYIHNSMLCSCYAIVNTAEYESGTTYLAVYDLKLEYASFYGFTHQRAPFSFDSDAWSEQAQLARSLALLFYAEVISDN